MTTKATETPSELASALLKELPGEAVMWSAYDRRLYEYDAALETARPEVVVFPRTTEDVQTIVRLCRELKRPFTARGAGTGLSGGAIPMEGGALICFTRMNQVLEIDEANLTALVQPGVVNLHLTEAVRHLGLYFSPDPSSQRASTIGGNVGENSGGPHTLASGVTTNHVLGLEIVLPDGDVAWLGGKAGPGQPIDLVGLVVGSEGMLGLVTKVLVRLMPAPEHAATLLAAFASVETASRSVSAVIAAGILPAALEMMDKLATKAIEDSVHAGYPADAGAVLLVDVEGLREEVAESLARIVAICQEGGALMVRQAASQKERNLLWAGRKGAFGAMGRLSPNFYTMDGVVPRTKLAAVLAGVDRISAELELSVASVFHAGDGNIHPLVLFDEDCEGDLDRVHEAARRILDLCIQAGGSLTGEHGIGVEKQGMVPMQFSPADLAVMQRVKQAFDPAGVCNPGKMFPTPGQCLELTASGSRLSGW
ncbi:MAG: FAD-linked oxidase C-terminal domain-containing protein [Dehalococcoidia bacterium]